MALQEPSGWTTFVEFEQLPDPPSGHYELQHGRVVLMPPRKKIHMQVQQALFDLLAPMLRGLGFITNEFAFRPAPEYEAWQADVGFVNQERWRKDDNEYFLGAPDLVVEVLSAGNTMNEILDRQDVCFEHGCVEIWTVDPKRKIVMVTTMDRKTLTYDQYTDMPVSMAEAKIKVAAIFPT